MAYLSPYSTSKHACDTYAACLRMELQHFGIGVTTVLASFHKTPLIVAADGTFRGADYVRKTWDRMAASKQAEYGEAVLECKGAWQLFNGNAEHETQTFRAVEGGAKLQRISIVAFTHSSYCKLPEDVASELRGLEFTARCSASSLCPEPPPLRVHRGCRGCVGQ